MAAQAASSVRGVGPRATCGGTAARGAGEASPGHVQLPELLCPLGTGASSLELTLRPSPSDSTGGVGTDGASSPAARAANIGCRGPWLCREVEENLGPEGVGRRPRAARSPRLLAPPGDRCLGPPVASSAPGGCQLHRVKAKAGAWPWHQGPRKLIRAEPCLLPLPPPPPPLQQVGSPGRLDPRHLQHHTPCCQHQGPLLSKARVSGQ